MHAHMTTTRTVRPPHSDQFPGVPRFVLEVNENVTDKDDHQHVLRGMLAVFVKMESANVMRESGKFYVLCRHEGERVWHVIRKAEVRRDHTAFTTAGPGNSFTPPTPAPIEAKKPGDIFVLGRVITSYSEHI